MTKLHQLLMNHQLRPLFDLIIIDELIR